MNRQHIGKLMLLLALLCVVCVALSGCIVDPDGGNEPVNTNTWNRYTAMPSDSATPTIEIVTPTPDPGTQSWDEPTGQPGVNTPVPAATIVPINGTASPTAGPDETPGSSVLQRGSQGQAVVNVQAALKRLGYFEGKTDGDYGEYTENAVKEFQRQNGLTPDGVVGPSTLSKLGSASAHTAPPKVTPGSSPWATWRARPAARCAISPSRPSWHSSAATAWMTMASPARAPWRRCIPPPPARRPAPWAWSA